MNIFRFLILSLVGLLLACSPIRTDQAPSVEVLFVGNSLTYVGNLPAVFDALAATNMKPTHSEMIAKGGATLTQWAANGSVKTALTGKHYDYVVLQERGGDLIYAFGQKASDEAEIAILELANIVTTSGATPISIGTTQPLPLLSQELVVAERVATRDEFPYISVSNHFQNAINTYPFGNWLYSDKAHPGPDLTLLKAVLLYRHFFGRLPLAKGFSVKAPIYTPDAHFFSPSPISVVDSSQIFLSGYKYTGAEMANIIEIIGAE